MNKPKNNGNAWTGADDQQLNKLAKGNTPTGLIAHKLGRTPDAVRSHAQQIGTSLKPVNKSPYNRRKP